MKIKLRKNKDDQDMDEFWIPWEIDGMIQPILMAVVHIDCFDKEISEAAKSEDDHIDAEIILI